MPLREDLLNPIAGENPAGENLRYAPVYDKIKEARREEDDAPQGEWKRERKVADHLLVIKLASESVATKSKDIQLAAWLTEAALKKEGFSGLRQGLDLLRGIVENFWENCYPEIEDGDMELRAAPLEWVGTRLEDPLKRAPLTRSGYGFYKYKESRTVPSEDDAAANDSKREQRDAAIADGKLTPEEFEQAFKDTSTAQYQAWLTDLDSCLASLESLDTLCQEKFADYSPGFIKLRTALEEVHHAIKGFVAKKIEAEGGPVETAESTEATEELAEEAVPETSLRSAASAQAKAKRKVVGLEPVDADDVTARLNAIAKFLRQTDANSPAPYLLLRGFRWGELRGFGESPDPTVLAPPSSEVRQQIKRLSLESNWTELLEIAETAMAEPCGRAWLDLQRYVVKACEESGYYAIASAIRSEVKALLADLPSLTGWSLMDDTPVANAETQAWLKEFAYPACSGNGSGASAQPEESPVIMYETPAAEPGDSREPAPPDVYELATQAARGGRLDEAVEILTEDIVRQPCGRGRFQRRLQLAQICMGAGYEALAQPILEELASEIDRHQLEDWETSEIVAHPLVMLYRCLNKLHGEAADKQKLYARICRLDPVQGLACTK
ncbi:MAG TPA: type VI secretion system protein TssA [Bryobacteraceae bacterium]|nr:type VI secretion system protein TssA [Bryobacteraceae bacterium]